MYDIAEMLKKGAVIRTDITLAHTKSISPPKGMAWLLIGGVIYHINGALSYLIIRSDTQTTNLVTVLLDPNNTVFNSAISDHEPTSIWPIFSTVAEHYHAQRSDVPILDTFKVWFFGGATALAHPIFLEWRIEGK